MQEFCLSDSLRHIKDNWWQGTCHLPAKQARLVPCDEVHVDCIGPWTIAAANRAEYEFNALTYISPVTNLVDIIRLNGSNPKAGYSGQRCDICWLSQYPQPNKCIYNNGNEFLGRGFQDILKKHEIQGIPTTVKNAQWNRICEQMH